MGGGVLGVNDPGVDIICLLSLGDWAEYEIRKEDLISFEVNEHCSIFRLTLNCEGIG